MDNHEFDMIMRSIDETNDRIDKLAEKVRRVANNPAPTVPTYDPDNFPQDGVEGQTAVGIDDNHYHYVNGAWKQTGINGLISTSVVFEAADFISGVTKTVIPGKPGYIIWPIELLFTVHFSDVPSWTTNSPQLTVQPTSATVYWHTWKFFDGPYSLSSGSLNGYFTTGNFDSQPPEVLTSGNTSVGNDPAFWANYITGEGLDIEANAGDASICVPAEVFVLARIVKWDPS